MMKMPRPWDNECVNAGAWVLHLLMRQLARFGYPDGGCRSVTRQTRRMRSSYHERPLPPNRLCTSPARSTSALCTTAGRTLAHTARAPQARPLVRNWMMTRYANMSGSRLLRSRPRHRSSHVVVPLVWASMAAQLHFASFSLSRRGMPSTHNGSCSRLAKNASPS